MFWRRGIGFHLTVSALVDPLIQETVQIVTNAPQGASREFLAELVARMRHACWEERVAANERNLELNRVLKLRRNERIEKFKADGIEVDQESIDEENRLIAASTIKLEAQVAADRVIQNGHH